MPTLFNGLLLMFVILLCIALPATICQPCSGCQGCCINTRNSSAICKCDKYCQEFGDCCDHTSHSNFSFTSSVPSGVELNCHSVINIQGIPAIPENGAFFMISSCPDSWKNFHNNSVSRKCSTPSQILPPVTDVSTGLVYKNEFCAQCHGVLEIMAWSTKLLCTRKVVAPYDFVDAINNNSNILNRACRSCSFHPPNIIHANTLPPRACFPKVQQCLSNQGLENVTGGTIEIMEYNKMAEDCQRGSQNLVSSISNHKIYHNNACASCNGEISTRCLEAHDIDICDPKLWCDIFTFQPSCLLPFTFTVTLSNLGNGLIDVSSMDVSMGTIKPCSNGKVLVGTECKSTFCPEGYSLKDGRCSYDGFESLPEVNYTSVNCSNPYLVLDNDSYINLGNGKILLVSEEKKVDVLEYDDSGRPIICHIGRLDCSTALVALNESDYTVLNNGSIVVKDKVVEVQFYDSTGRPLICPDLIKSTTNSRSNLGLVPSIPGVQELTYVGSSFSVLGCIAVLLTYSIFKELQTFPGVIVMNLCIPIAATNLLFIVGGPALHFYPTPELCTAFAVSLHFFYLSQFSWMSVFSFDITRTFYIARKLIHSTNEVKWRYLLAYVTVGWVFPLAVATITVIINFTVDGLAIYGTSDEDKMAECWITHQLTYFLVFLTPVAISLTLNLVFFATTTVFLCKMHRDQAKVQKSNINALIRVWFAAFSTSGLTWLFGFIAVLQGLTWMWYLFVFFNSIQGFSIFLALVFTKKVFNLYKTLLTKKLRINRFASQTTKTSGIATL